MILDAIRFAAATAALCLFACGQEEPAEPGPAAGGEATPGTAPASAPVDPGFDWVGSAECASCHAEEASRWQGSHHDLAMQEATAETVLADFGDATFRDGPVTWTFTRRDGRFVARSTGAEQGEYEVAYAFGVDPLQQYLIAFPDGRIQALHVAWDARPADAGGQRWFSLDGKERVPAGDPVHWKGPAKTWNAMCGECHTTGFGKGFELAANRYSSTWTEVGVGCEACHGPGSRHVEWARSPAATASRKRSSARSEAAPSGDQTGAADHGLVAHLDPPTRWTFAAGEPTARPVSGALAPSSEVEACAACHSQRGRITEAPQAGEAFLDGYQPAFLDRGLYHDDGQIDEEVYEWGSFVQSRMYGAGVRCSDCHDPHSAALRAEGNALCGGCHEPARFDVPEHHHHPADSVGASCVACHMPTHTVMSIDPRRDHSFSVPRPDLTLRIGSPNACAACHASRGDAWSAKAMEAWRGGAAPPGHFAERLHERRSAGSAAGDALKALFRDPTAPAIARATALLELLPVPPTYDRIAEVARGEDPILRLAAARAALALTPRQRVLAIGWLVEDPLRAVRIEAASTLADVPSELLSESLRGARSRALEEYRRALGVSADQPAAHVNLAVLHQRQGDVKAAEDAYLTALRLGDYFVPAYTNLSDLYAAQKRDGEGAALLHRGLERTPDSADLHFALGLLLARQEQAEPALKELAAATRLAPEIAYFAFAYGVALNTEGRARDALAVLRPAVERHPNDQNLLGAIATIARDARRFDEALEAAKRLQALFPQQPEARAIVEDIENRRAGGQGGRRPTRSERKPSGAQRGEAERRSDGQASEGGPRHGLAPAPAPEHARDPQ